MKGSEKKYNNWDLIKDLASFVSPYKGMFIFGTSIRAISDIAWLYPALALAQIINYLSTGGKDFSSLYPIFFLLFLAALIHYIGRDLAKFLVYQVAEKAALHASLKTLKHLISLDITWHEKENSGNKMKRISHGYDGINSLCRMFVDLVIESTINTVLMITIIGTFDGAIASFMVIYLISYYVLSFLLLKKAEHQSYLVNVEEEHIQGQFFEIINNIATVKWLGLENNLLKKFKSMIEYLIELIRVRIKYFRFRSGALGLYNDFFRLILAFYVVYFIIQGAYLVGFLIIVFNYFSKLQEAADELATVTSEFIIQKIRIKRMRDILNQVPEVELSGHLSFPKNWKYIFFKNVSFSYNNEKYIHDFNLSIRRGEKIGIVGLSGAGKTTVFKLLLKLYDDYQGEIYFDNKPLKEIKRHDYLKHTAVVLQDTEVFNLSVAENITLSHEDINQHSLQKALDTAHISEFLYKLPNGIYTLIGEKGVKLSGGEKQRVGIARAIYKNPQILFLDEATSHLDVESEEKIQDSLQKFFKNVTAIVIAHRLSTIKQMDRIVVMKSGQVIEQGSFDYLLKKKGEFYRLWQKQVKKNRK